MPKSPTYVHKYSARKVVPGCAQVVVLEETNAQPSYLRTHLLVKEENQKGKFLHACKIDRLTYLQNLKVK